MLFDPAAYGDAVVRILALDGNGQRLMPLAHGMCSSAEARRRLSGASARDLFPQSRAPEAALSGLFLYFSCREEAHAIVQDLTSAEGSYWHAIVHRQEPDASNSSYWFRQVGTHATFPELRAQAAEIGVDFGPHWDPFAFIELCERARQEPGSTLEANALAVQRAEWQLLFHFCAAAEMPTLR